MGGSAPVQLLELNRKRRAVIEYDLARIKRGEIEDTYGKGRRLLVNWYVQSPSTQITETGALRSRRIRAVLKLKVVRPVKNTAGSIFRNWIRPAIERLDPQWTG